LTGGGLSEGSREPPEPPTLIRGVRPIDGTADPTSILVADGRIAATGRAAEDAATGARLIDAAGSFVAPGFIDLQVNGGFGRDFTADPTAIWDVGERLAAGGVTAFLPTIVSSPAGVMAAAMATLVAGAPPGYRGAWPLGLHLEGPFLNPVKRGAHRPDHLRLPDAAIAADWSPEAGVLVVTIAPELPGGLALIRDLADRGIVVSAGHSLATHDEGVAGIEAGVRYATHLFNAMPVLDHREPGLIAALLGDARVTVGLIADGIHVAPAVVDLAWRLAGPDRVSIVSDSMAALGMEDGRYPLGDDEVEVSDGAARTSDGRLAGGVLPLAGGVRNLVRFTGCSAAEAVATATSNPARLLRLRDRGCLDVGAIADLVLLTGDLTVDRAFVRGRPVEA
jgi:N-acetylglucosamine-6-phosphate deacetylase